MLIVHTILILVANFEVVNVVHEIQFVDVYPM